MADDNTFRLVLIVVVAAFAPFAVYHRIRSVTNEKLDRWQEGVIILFGLRLSGLPMFVGGIAWMIDPQWMAWSSIAIPAWLRWLGVAVVGLHAAGGAVCATLAIERHITACSERANKVALYHRRFVRAADAWRYAATGLHHC